MSQGAGREKGCPVEVTGHRVPMTGADATESGFAGVAGLTVSDALSLAGRPHLPPPVNPACPGWLPCARSA